MTGEAPRPGDDSHRAPTPGWAALGSLLLVVAAGVAMAAQARIGAALAEEWASPLLAVAWVIYSGMGLLVLACLALPAGRRGLAAVARAARRRILPWWALLGGVAGATFVAAQTTTTPLIGVALFTVAVVAGQALGGIVLDRTGILGMTPRGLTTSRAVGATVSLVAVVVASWGQVGAGAWWAFLFAFAAGAATAWQQAVNGSVGATAGFGLVGAAVNFLCGSLLTTLVLAGWAIAATPPAPHLPPAWMLAGGALGAFAAFAQVVTVRRIGVLVLGLGQLVGQFAGALTIDALVPVPGHRLVWTTVVATALAIVGASVAVRRRRPGRETGAA